MLHRKLNCATTKSKHSYMPQRSHLTNCLISEQLPLNDSKSSHIVVRHHTSRLELKLDQNHASTSFVTVHSGMDLGVHAKEFFILSLNCQCSNPFTVLCSGLLILSPQGYESDLDLQRLAIGLLKRF